MVWRPFYYWAIYHDKSILFKLCWVDVGEFGQGQDVSIEIFCAVRVAELFVFLVLF